MINNISEQTTPIIISEDPGNGFENAYNLGSLNTPITWGEFININNQVGDLDDFYRFDIESPRAIEILVSGVSVTIDVQLFAGGSYAAPSLFLSNATPSSPLSRTVTLERGSYYLKIFTFSVQSSDYQVTLNIEAVPSPVYRFYNPISRGHFFTANLEERDNVLANPEWGYNFEGIGFNASTIPDDNLLPVFRFYNPSSRGHFFTINQQERDTVLANPQWGYNFEGIGFYAYGSDANLGRDIYRFYNPFSQGHFFTSNLQERDTVLANPQWGYQFEGVAFEEFIPS